MQEWLTGIDILSVTRNMVEILVLAMLFYYILLFFRGTRGATVLTGLAVLLIILIVVTRVLYLDALSWLLERFSVYLAVAFLVIFQPEIRRALAEIGKQNVFTSSSPDKSMVENIIQAVVKFSRQRTGALIAMERDIKTRAIKETGSLLDSSVTPEILASIFHFGGPLHDGGVIISGNRIAAAGCTFPLSQQELRRPLGTRHRAAVGMSEETDAVVLVVSEETGSISIGYRGRLIEDLSEDQLRKFLTQMLVKPKNAKSRISNAGAHLDLTPSGVARTEEMNKNKQED